LTTPVGVFQDQFTVLTAGAVKAAKKNQVFLTTQQTSSKTIRNRQYSRWKVTVGGHGKAGVSINSSSLFLFLLINF